MPCEQQGEDATLQQAGTSMIKTTKGSALYALSTLLALVVSSQHLSAQETDLTNAPNTIGAGIARSFAEQIGAGQGDLMTPNSSVFLIGRDPFRSIARGRSLFQRKFTHAEGNGPRTGDGMGNLDRDGSIAAGMTDSCAACHGRPRGSAGVGGNVFTRPDSRDAPHLFGLGLVEMLADEITSDLRASRDRALMLAKRYNRTLRVRLRSKGISYGSIIARPDGTVNTSRVQGVDEDLRVRPFFAEGSTISIREFAAGAFNAEMGLEAYDPILQQAAAGSDVATPSGMQLSGSMDAIEAPPTVSELDDPDGDGVVNEIPTSIIDHMEFYLLNYFKPGIGRQTYASRRGKKLMQKIGCTQCHIPNLVIDHDRRVADIETRYDPSQQGFNHLLATATPLFEEVDDGSGFATIKRPLGGRFVVRNFYGDFKRHDLGPAFHERNFDGSMQTEFVTEPLWGVGTTAPYGHDGRSIDLHEVILRHGGEAQHSRRLYQRLAGNDQEAITAFLNTLVLFPPLDTASNLDPADPTVPGFPQKGHGSIKLSVLFNNPTIIE